MKVDNILRYGTILTDDELYSRCSEIADCVRVRFVSYNNALYYIKMVNGDCVELRKWGLWDELDCYC